MKGWDLYVPDLDHPDNSGASPDPSLDITVDKVETANKKLKGGSGPDSDDAAMMMMHNLLLRHKGASCGLSKFMAQWVL